MTKLQKGSVSISVFKPDKIPADIAVVREALERFAFKKLEPEDVRDESTGWVDAILCFDNEKFNSLMHDNYFVFALRTDKYSFGAAQIRPYFEEALYLFQIENNLEYVAAQQVKEIKEQVVRRMKMNSYPKTTITEVAWDMDKGTVYLFSQSGQVIPKFVDIFEKTFETNLEDQYLFDSLKDMGGPEKVGSVIDKIWSF